MSRRLAVLRLACLSAALTLAPEARPYGTQEGYTLVLPEVRTSFFVALDAFGTATSTAVDGYALRGRMIAAANDEIYLQRNFGASVWMTVARVAAPMDPSFIRVSPGGTRVALGEGPGRPLAVFAPSVLSVDEPPLLDEHVGVLQIVADYYDATWLDERYLFVNSGAIVGGSLGSRIFALDTEGADPRANWIPIIEEIPGASGGVAFDRHGNLITGIGYGLQEGFDTGQLKIWPAADVLATLEDATSGLAYTNTGHVLAEGMLSAASLGVDANGNLYVGGGDVFGGSGNFGYAALLDASVLERALDGGAPLDRENPEEFRKIAPDPCENDDFTSVLFVESLDMLVVSANLASQPPNCSDADWSGVPGVSPPGVQLFFPPGAIDSDGDGIPDGADNAYLTPNPDQRDTSGNGFGDAADFDFNDDGRVDHEDLSILVDAFGLQSGDPGFDPRLDLIADDVVDFEDLELFLERWGQVAPFY